MINRKFYFIVTSWHAFPHAICFRDCWQKLFHFDVRVSSGLRRFILNFFKDFNGNSVSVEVSDGTISVGVPNS